MNLRELLDVKRRMDEDPEWVSTLPKNYGLILSERIASEKAKLLKNKHDPVLEAKINKWIAEGRINQEPSMGAFV